MRIALDATYSVGENLSGVGVYSREILYGLAALAEPGMRWLWCYRPHRYLRSWREPLPAGCSRRLLWASRAPRAAIFHGLNQRLPPAPGVRTVATFHDLFVMTGDYSTPDFRRRFAAQARDAASRSDLLIAISSFTASQVETLLGVERSRIRVISHGVRPPAETFSAPREPLILSVGALQRRKNTIRLVEAFERTRPGWRLVLAGSLGFGAAEALERIEKSPRRADIRTTGYVSNAELERLYAGASIFAFPSLDEGFGMPVLDAMARGLPVITSNRSALPEVAGDAALLVDPESVESIHHALAQLIDSPALREDFAARGRTRSAMFSWENAARATRGVYSELD